MLLAGEDQVLAHGQLREDLQELEGAAHAEAVEVGRAHAGDVLAVEADLALVRRSWPRMQLNRVDLPRAVRADDAEDLALAHLEGDAVHRRDAAEALGDAFDFENRLHCAAPVEGGAAARRGGRRAGAPVGLVAVEEAEEAGRRIDEEHHHEQGVEDEVEPLREAQPFGQQHRDERAEERPEEEAGAAHDHHQQEIERQGEREGRRVDDTRRAAHRARPRQPAIGRRRWRRRGGCSAACRRRATAARMGFSRRAGRPGPRASGSATSQRRHDDQDGEDEVVKSDATVEMPNMLGRGISAIPEMPPVSHCSLRETR